EDPAASIGATQSRQIVGREVTEDSIAILLFSGALDFSFGVETGWRGVGPRGGVTKASGAGVLEIDDRPAIEFYERYVGLGQPPLGNPLAVFETPSSPAFYLRAPRRSSKAPAPPSRGRWRRIRPDARPMPRSCIRVRLVASSSVPGPATRSS